MIPKEVLNAVKDMQLQENEIFKQCTASDKTITLSESLWGFVNGLRAAKIAIYNQYIKVGDNLFTEVYEAFDGLELTIDGV